MSCFVYLCAPVDVPDESEDEEEPLMETAKLEVLQLKKENTKLVEDNEKLRTSNRDLKKQQRDTEKAAEKSRWAVDAQTFSSECCAQCGQLPVWCVCRADARPAPRMATRRSCGDLRAGEFGAVQYCLERFRTAEPRSELL